MTNKHPLTHNMTDNAKRLLAKLKELRASDNKDALQEYFMKNIGAIIEACYPSYSVKVDYETTYVSYEQHQKSVVVERTQEPNLRYTVYDYENYKGDKTVLRPLTIYDNRRHHIQITLTKSHYETVVYDPTNNPFKQFVRLIKPTRKYIYKPMDNVDIEHIYKYLNHVFYGINVDIDANYMHRPKAWIPHKLKLKESCFPYLQIMERYGWRCEDYYIRTTGFDGELFIKVIANKSSACSRNNNTNCERYTYMEAVASINSKYDNDKYYSLPTTNYKDILIDFWFYYEFVNIDHIISTLECLLNNSSPIVQPSPLFV